MKNKFFILTFLFSIALAGFTLGQNEKGNFLIGGQTGSSYSVTTTSVKAGTWSGAYSKSWNIGFTPLVGYFISKNLLAGLQVPMSAGGSKQVSTNDIYKTSSIEFIPFIRKYFGTSKLRPFIFGAIGSGLGRAEGSGPSYSSPSTTRYFLFTWETGGGAAFFLNEFISVDLSIGYRYHSDRVKYGADGNTQQDHTIIDKGPDTKIGISVCY